MPQSGSLAFVEGYVGSAGMGSESVVQASRLALVERLDALPMENEELTLVYVANTLLDVFKANLTNDRIVLPLLEVLAFLLDSQVLQKLVESSFKYVKWPLPLFRISEGSRLLIFAHFVISLADGAVSYPLSRRHTSNPITCKSSTLHLMCTEAWRMFRLFDKRCGPS